MDNSATKFFEPAGRVLILAFLFSLPYAGIVGVLLIPGWLFSCLQTKRIAPWSGFFQLLTKGLFSLLLASGLLLPGILLLSIAKGFQGGFTVSKGILLLQESTAGNVFANLGLIALLAGIMLLPGFFQTAAAGGKWRDVFSIVCLQERIARASYLRSVVCGFALLLGFFLMVGVIELAGPLFGRFEAVIATAGIAMLEALLAVMIVRQFFDVTL